MISLLLALTLCGTPDDPGITMYDGTCMTISRYNATFSAEALATVPSLTLPDRSVAEVYDIVPGVAADRLLGAGLSAYPFTFRQWVAV